MPEHYDYIITGAGCAGLSLLMRMMQHDYFSTKKILVIDQSFKTANDRTWCFWEKSEGLFEPIIYHRWSKLHFFSNTFSSTLDISPYQYKMIRGIDFYNYVLGEITGLKHITFKHAHVDAVENKRHKVQVVLGEEILTADYVFNSILFAPLVTGAKYEYHLMQHFKGWVIETAKPSFNDAVATLMDFRLDQEHGATFMYVMPTTPTTALVEYTLFTEGLLPSQAYDVELKNYIGKVLNVTQYRIIHEEFGMIPMTNRCFPACDGNIINIGLPGGQVKGSSGYAFQFIQKRTAAIVDALLKSRSPCIQPSFAGKRFLFYDSVLLQLLQQRKIDCNRIFADIFAANRPDRVLRFLDNESKLADEVGIIRSMPARIFLPAAIKQLFS